MIEIDKILDAQIKWQAASIQGGAAARDTAIESLVKCADAIAVLEGNLKEIGYGWADVERIPAEVLERNVSTIEKTIGSPVPQILVMFWEKVGGVSLVDLENYQHVDFWKEQKIIAPGHFCDGLHVDPCNHEWAAFLCGDFFDWKEYSAQDESDRFLLELSPDGYHKDNISGGAAYGVYAESSWKPIWQNFVWTGAQTPVTALASPPDFLSYLRTTVLECAGFPAFLGSLGFDPIRERLLRGVPVF